MKKFFSKFKKMSGFKKALVIICILLFSIALVVIPIQFANLIKRQNRIKSFKKMPYSEFLTLLDQNEIDAVEYNPNEKYMVVCLHNEKTHNMSIEEREDYLTPQEDCYTVYFPKNSEDFFEKVLSHDVILSEMNGFKKDFGQLGQIFYWIFIIVIMSSMMKRMSPMSNNTIEQIGTSDLEVEFDDIIGLDEIKDDIKLLVKQLKSKNKNIKELSHGILFEGTPGTGKTTLAKAVAKEAGFNFISVKTSALVELYVGNGARRVREAFAKARENMPCIIFFDEIDAVGTSRGQSHTEHDQTLNALLSEMDGFSNRGELLVIAATNRVADLDKALVRAGRFDRIIHIDVPKRWEDRKDLFDHYIYEYFKDKVDASVDTESLAKQTVGYSPSDIASICREANLVRYSKDEEKVTQDDLEEAIDKILFKGNRSSHEKQETLEIVSYHEAGHAVMNLICGKSIARISVMGMTSGVGGAVFQSDENHTFSTKKDIEKQLYILYAGRASEEIKYGTDNITNGASNDIAEATKLLVSYVTKFGFDNAVIDYSILGKEGISNSSSSEKIEELSVSFYTTAVDRLKENYEAVEILAKKLMEVKTLSGEEVQELDLPIKEYAK